MKKKVLFPAAILAIAVVICFPQGKAAGESDQMLPEHALWLEDVGPIISPVERDVFLKLVTDRERETFIRFFWRTRDSIPDTSDNEYQREYMARVRFADQNFGRESSKRGSQTDRGFYYLLLGPPLERQRFVTQSELWPAELWFYKGEGEYGLPPYFYLIFFQAEGIGDYRLYSPGIDGPEKLVIPGSAGRGLSSRGGAVEVIRKVSSELASASLSYLAGEGASASGAFSSDNIIASVKRLPGKKYADGYARTFLSYKGFIETEYADRYLESAFLVKVFNSAGQQFIHWSIEPETMNFGQVDGTIYASYELLLRIEDSGGKPLFEKEEEIPLKLTPEQYKLHQRQRFAFQDLAPVIPGDHKILFLLKNKTGREFSSHETRISVPEADAAGFSSVLLHHGHDLVPEGHKGMLKAFTFDESHYPVSARNEFIPTEKMGVFLQAFHPSRLVQGGSPSFILEIIALETGTVVLTDSLVVSPGSGRGRDVTALTAEVDLTPLRPGYYRLEASAAGPEGHKILTQKENFIILSRPLPVLPWAYARLHGPFPGLEHLRAVGAQFFLAGDYARARAALEAALGEKEDPATRLLLAKTFYGSGLFTESLRAGLPLYEKSADREAGKVIALDYAALKEWEEALVYLESLMSDATEVGVLNLASECYMNLNRPEKAFPLLQKSLSLVPDQPLVKKLEEKAKKILGIK